MFKQGFLWVSLLVCQSMSGYFITGRIWQNVDSKGNIHTVVGLGDCHIGHKEEENQFVALMNSIPQNALVIAEDSAGLEYDASFFRYMKRNRYGAVIKSENGSTLLWQVPIACRSIGIKSKNVEFRHYDKKLKEMIDAVIKKRAKVTCKELASALKTFCKTTKDYIHGTHNYRNSQFNELRNKILQWSNYHLQNLLDFAEFLEHKSNKDNHVTTALLQEYMKKYEITKRIDEVIGDILVPILDVRILRQIVDNNSCDIFVIAGAKHIENIENVLGELGYKLVKSEGTINSIGPINIVDLLSEYCPLIRNAKLQKCEDTIEILPSRLDPKNARKQIFGGLILFALLYGIARLIDTYKPA